MNSLQSAVDFLSDRFKRPPKLAVVLGSGLGAFAESLKNSLNIPCHEIPGGVGSTVVGHRGNLYIGECGKNRIAVVSGRLHGFEGHTPTQVVHNLRALRAWGVERFILTNATGSTRLSFRPGNLVLIKDHINFTGQNPLTGKELYEGERFPDMSDAYSKDWRARAKKIGKSLKLTLKEAVYAGVAGPSYETASEIRMLARLGADIVGMSTVWETIALKQMGAQILGISCVTNYGTGVTNKPLSHEEVLETTEKVRDIFIRLLNALIEASL